MLTPNANANANPAGYLNQRQLYELSVALGNFEMYTGLAARALPSTIHENLDRSELGGADMRDVSRYLDVLKVGVRVRVRVMVSVRVRVRPEGRLKISGCPEGEDG